MRYGDDGAREGHGAHGSRPAHCYGTRCSPRALIAGCVPFNGVTSPDSTGGILFPATQASMTLWSLPVFVPLMLRRYRPEPAAWLFVALTITHLVLGPAITYFDFYALIMGVFW